jgi:hypothetical protein
MRRSFIFASITALAIFVLGGVTASAQVGQLRGHVILKQPDGTKTKATGAQVDVFRVDLAGTYPTKADKNGEFVYAGLPLAGTYIIAVSMPSAGPAYQVGVRSGRDIDYEMVMSPGDGRRLKLDEIKKYEAGAGPSSTSSRGETAEEKAKREEMLKKNAEIEASNAKATETNKVVSDSFSAGNTALLSKNWDEAIKQYDLGLAADANQAALLTNKAAALKGRGVDRFNAAIQLKDEATKNPALEAARADFKGAVEASNRAAELISKEAPQTDPVAQKQQEVNKYATLSVRAESYRLFVTKADPSQAEAGAKAFQEYMAVETDPVKKSKAQLDLAKMLLDAGAGDKAFVEFQKILAEKPDDPDANRGAGLALFSTGDKTKYKEAANYLQHFVDKAPDTHPDKQSAKDALEYLKTSENIVPEKTTAPPRKKRP